MSPPVRNELPPGHRRNAVWRSIQFVLQNVFTIWLQYRVRGLNNLPEGAALLVANHQSFLDPLLVGLSLHRPVSYLARDSLFKVPVIGWILRKTYVLPIRRDAAGTESLRISLRRLEEGFLVGVFPEGTRTRDGHLGPLKPGFVALVRRSRVPLVPVAISGAYEALPRGAFFLRPRAVRVVFGKPISPDELEAFQGRGSEVALVRLVTDRLNEALNEADAWRKM
ncbi:1-acyl-sn-glycerol-3-phosphate acyltransferase [Caulifigura coniformis]|uniref:1-acyl-sn-glycerol-3-phosphate acyltransferase n=1 Tax=Caulifigura coniformis TaxID=2527983 RepID=A0A517SFZ3_9PLAN|nr:lysophospholipid acyltransferase family protein [Caulifigura coniformis]QDT55056.1 1-acyl-sn-glycerol-3-phosphate acyltransferase [Caulifigura coniformis]